MEREMTLQEEIEALNIEEHVKKRLLSKLEKHDLHATAELAEQRERMYSIIRSFDAENTALLNSCEALCRTMTIVRRRAENV